MIAHSIRREPTYLSTDVWKALWLLAKALDDPPRSKTPDELADTLLRELISNKYPQIYEHVSKVQKLEAELIKTLQK